LGRGNPRLLNLLCDVGQAREKHNGLATIAPSQNKVSTISLKNSLFNRKKKRNTPDPICLSARSGKEEEESNIRFLLHGH
jgi:hypothetical protein